MTTPAAIIEAARERFCSSFNEIHNTTTILEDCFLPRAALQHFWDDSETSLLQLRMTLTALVIIYAASHGAIQRPFSAAPAKRQTKPNPDKTTEEDDKEMEVKEKQVEEDEKTHQYGQTLIASDIIMFPLTACIMLVGLYYIIKWLDDPALLNRVVRWWIGTVGMVSSTVFYWHGIQVGVNLVLPNFWAGKNGEVYGVHARSHSVWAWVAGKEEAKGEGKEKSEGKGEETWKRVKGGRYVFPGPWFGNGVDAAKASTTAVATGAETLWMVTRKRLADLAWEVLNLFHDRWCLVVDVPSWRGKKGGVWIKERFTMGFVVSFLVALGVAGLHAVTQSMSASNVSGLAMSYGSILMISPASFPLGTAVMLGLCVYDIIMVFYTPFMVTVARAIDAPIKLSFQTANGGTSILGLGDIIIPGMIIAMCLRFDLWRHYNARIVSEPVTLEIEVLNADGSTETQKTESTTQKKAPYIDPQGRWGDWLWLAVRGRQMDVKAVRDSMFQKTYFWAAMTGYGLGMLITMLVLTVFRHGQPALLYLVPGVLGMVWGTALVRGELGVVWGYSEDHGEDVEDVVVTTEGAATRHGENLVVTDSVAGEGEKTAETGQDGKGGDDDASSSSSEASGTPSASTESSEEDETEGEKGWEDREDEIEDIPSRGWDSDDDWGEDEPFDAQRDVLFSFSVVGPKRLRMKVSKTETVKGKEDGGEEKVKWEVAEEKVVEEKMFP